MAKLAQSYQIIIDDWLTEFDVAGKEKINPDLSQEINFGQMVQGLVQQIQNLTGQNVQLQQTLGAITGMGPDPGGPGMPGPPQGPTGPPGVPPMAPGQPGPMPPGASPGGPPVGLSG